MLARDQPGVETWQEYFIWKLAGYTVKTTNGFFCFMKILLVCFFFFFIRKGKELNSSYTEVSGRGHPFKCLARWR